MSAGAASGGGGERFAFLRWRRGEAAERGRAGERAAAWWLWWRGYRILARNLATGAGEIDLVCEQRGVCVFVEVKTRTVRPAGEGDGTGGDEVVRDPLDAIDRRKRRNLRAAAAGYLARFDPAEVPHRFDAIAVERSPTGRCRVVRHERDILAPIPPRGLVATAPASIDAALRAALAGRGDDPDELLEE